ncbi:MAG: hypothetical protein KDD53_11635 [Bdellovibrionales bacterium]|nr:hypothetical protein [Bdellovibrionales bacterium]
MSRIATFVLLVLAVFTACGNPHAIAVQRLLVDAGRVELIGGRFEGCFVRYLKVKEVTGSAVNALPYRYHHTSEMFSYIEIPLLSKLSPLTRGEDDNGWPEIEMESSPIDVGDELLVVYDLENKVIEVLDANRRGLIPDDLLKFEGSPLL